MFKPRAPRRAAHTEPSHDGGAKPALLPCGRGAEAGEGRNGDIGQLASNRHEEHQAPSPRGGSRPWWRFYFDLLLVGGGHERPEGGGEEP